mgnify:CR=1 FL=1
MKKYIFLSTLLFTVYFSQGQIVNIPDANFKNALVNTLCVDTNGDGIVDADADTNNDGEIQISEAEVVLHLNVSNHWISSLEGIQSFINLEFLNSGINVLDSIDVTQLPNLVYLNVLFNNLISLDVTQNLNLVELNCANNYFSSGLDVTNNQSLETLWCSECWLSSIDVTQNPNLKILDVILNNLSSLDVTQNPNLEILYCASNQISNLNISQNSNLKGLACGSNELSSLNVSLNSNLEYLNVGGSSLTSLDVSVNSNLENLIASETNIINLDLGLNSNLIYVDCQNNPSLTSLNIKNGNNINMTRMLANDNPNLFCIQVDDENATYPPCIDEGHDGWCVDNWVEYSEECVLGITELNHIEINIYPNPVRDLLNIHSEMPFDLLKIYNLQGQLIKETKNNQTDVSFLSPGLYFASIIIDRKNIIKKFIKHK